MGNRMDRLPRQNDGGNHTNSQRESTQSSALCEYRNSRKRTSEEPQELFLKDSTRLPLIRKMMTNQKVFESARSKPP